MNYSALLRCRHQRLDREELRALRPVGGARRLEEGGNVRAVGRVSERGASEAVGGAHVGAARDEEPRRGEVALARRQVERGVVVVGPERNVGALVDEQVDGGGVALPDGTTNQEELAPLLRVGAVVDAAAVAFGETYVKQARNGGPQNFRGTIVAAAVMDDHWNVKYDADGETYATEAQHLTLVSAPSDDDAPARRAKKRAAAATPKKAKKARKICVEC